GPGGAPRLGLGPPGLHGVLAVVDADELDVLPLRLLVDLDEMGGLLGARSAPAGPEVDEDDRTPVVGAVPRRAVEGLARELDRLLPLARLEEGDVAVAGAVPEVLRGVGGAGVGGARREDAGEDGAS